MAVELYWLALAAGLCLLTWIPYTLQYLPITGLKSGTTDVPPTDQLPEWARRCHRAHMNQLETLAPFAVIVLVASISGQATTGTATAAMIYFWARLAYAVVYTLGVPMIRTPLFAIALLCGLYVLGQIIF